MAKPPRVASCARLAALAALLAASAWLASCTPGSGLTPEESDVVATLYDRTFGFGGVGTYALTDSIVHVTGDPGGPDSRLRSHDLDDEIAAQVANELDALGWNRVSDPNVADMVVLLAATASTTVPAYTGWYGYWGWYYPFQDTWGWYYPYPVVSYEYTTGTLVILMSDPASADAAAHRYSIRWVAAINGLLHRPGSGQAERVARGIAQAFDQSPYLAPR